LVPELIRPIQEGTADLVLGSRILGGEALGGGMPLYKYLSNRFLTLVENLAFRKRLSEYHTGFRAYSRRFLETIPFLLNSDRFVFDSEILAQAVAYGFEITEIPVPTRYFKEASSVGVKDGLVYGIQTLGIVAKYLLNRFGILKSDQFQKRLSEIVSRYHSPGIFLRKTDS
jgi:hypothetical protein